MSEPFQQTIEVADDLSEVGRVQEELAGLWEARALPPEVETTVSLALEEVLSNVLRHAKTDGRSSEIRITFRVNPGGFEFQVSDSAEAFDPLAQLDPDVSLPLDQRRPGGLGVFLVKKLADELSYERRDGRNCLRFVKRF